MMTDRELWVSAHNAALIAGSAIIERLTPESAGARETLQEWASVVADKALLKAPEDKP